MKVCIGGTFNILHIGHKYLIDKAFEKAGEKGSVFIGLTSEEFVKNKKNIKPFIERKEKLHHYLDEKGYLNRSIIKPIFDKYGPTIDEDFDAIIVSPDTRKTAEDINNKRRKNGKPSLEIIEIPFIRGNDGEKISSTRIFEKEIDENGNILKRD